LAVAAAALETASVLASSIDFFLVDPFRPFSKKLSVLKAFGGEPIHVGLATEADGVHLSGCGLRRFPFHHVLVIAVGSNIGFKCWCWCCGEGVPSCVAAACSFLLCPLTVELHVVTHVYTPLSKPSIRVSVASRKAYKAVSYLVAKCVAEVGYLRVIVLSFCVGVGNLFLKARVEGYEGLVFSLAYRVQILDCFLLAVAFSIKEFKALKELTRVWRVLSKLHLVERCNIRLCCSFKAHEDVA
jgi:hypothetical protein